MKEKLITTNALILTLIAVTRTSLPAGIRLASAAVALALSLTVAREALLKKGNQQR